MRIGDCVPKKDSGRGSIADAAIKLTNRCVACRDKAVERKQSTSQLQEGFLGQLDDGNRYKLKVSPIVSDWLLWLHRLTHRNLTIRFVLLCKSVDKQIFWASRRGCVWVEREIFLSNVVAHPLSNSLSRRPPSRVVFLLLHRNFPRTSTYCVRAK
jgi:hypothetical protein